MSEWISVDDQIPERNQRVKVKIKGYNKPRYATYFANVCEDGFLESLGYKWILEDRVPGGDFCGITHWKPLAATSNG